MAKCGYECNQGECGLIAFINNQASAGGNPAKGSPDLSGPYWPEKDWKRLVRNTLDTAKRINCPEQSKLRRIINSTTQSKKSTGQIYKPI